MLALAADADVEIRAVHSGALGAPALGAPRIA
jgi:hypothetical protein